MLRRSRRAHNQRSQVQILPPVFAGATRLYGYAREPRGTLSGPRIPKSLRVKASLIRSETSANAEGAQAPSRGT